MHLLVVVGLNINRRLSSLSWPAQATAAQQCRPPTLWWSWSFLVYFLFPWGWGTDDTFQFGAVSMVSYAYHNSSTATVSAIFYFDSLLCNHNNNTKTICHLLVWRHCFIQQNIAQLWWRAEFFAHRRQRQASCLDRWRHIWSKFKYWWSSLAESISRAPKNNDHTQYIKIIYINTQWVETTHHTHQLYTYQTDRSFEATRDEKCTKSTKWKKNEEIIEKYTLPVLKWSEIARWCGAMKRNVRLACAKYMCECVEDVGHPSNFWCTFGEQKYIYIYSCVCVRCCPQTTSTPYSNVSNNQFSCWLSK